MRTIKPGYITVTLLAIAGLATWHSMPAVLSRANTHQQGIATTPINHVVVIMMENHTFDNLFGRYPGANGVSNLPRAGNPTEDYNHDGPSLFADMDGGKMDEFPERGHIQYTQSDIPNYWAYAQQFGLGDNFFTSMATNSTPNHISMITAQSAGLDDTATTVGSGCTT